MRILGINALYHDPSAALVVGGRAQVQGEGHLAGNHVDGARRRAHRAELHGLRIGLDAQAGNLERLDVPGLGTRTGRRRAARGSARTSPARERRIP